MHCVFFSPCFLFNSFPFFFLFLKISLLGYLLVGSSPSPLITSCAFLLLIYIWIVYHLLHFFLSLLCLPFFRPQGSLPLRCLTSWSGWAWSPSRWSGCPSSTGWPQQNPQNTRPNATSANSVPSRASGRHGCVVGAGRLLFFLKSKWKRFGFKTTNIHRHTNSAVWAVHTEGERA